MVAFVGRSVGCWKKVRKMWKLTGEMRIDKTTEPELILHKAFCQDSEPKGNFRKYTPFVHPNIHSILIFQYLLIPAKLSDLCQDLLNTDVDWISFTAVQSYCNPVSVHMNCILTLLVANTLCLA